MVCGACAHENITYEVTKVMENTESYFTGTLVNSKRTIYTPSSFAKNNLTYLQEVGETTAIKPHVSKRSNLPSFLFFTVIKGSGSVKYGNVTYEVKAGDCVFLDCMQPYEHTSSNDLWTLKWVHFYGNTMNAIYEKYKERGGTVVFAAPEPLNISKLISDIHITADSGSYLRDMEIHEKLASLLLFIMRESWHESNIETDAEKRQDIRNIREYLDRNFNTAITLDELAMQYNISKFYLSHIFTKTYGISVNNYIIRLRITKAKHLLRFTDRNLAQIANECGYEDVNYFIRAFKRIENVTPGEYRKQW